ncbi:PepSY domain-containing protein [Profundibacter sp.]|uniref:PepSY domain-containing protein n=1 Tax=Profundibacter sp. TaxID=3101071 RepID=UPI003D14913D
MKISLMLASVLAAMSVGTLAYADDGDCYVPMSNWQSREAVRNMAEAQGWNVRRIKINDGCYEVKGYDASGRKIEAKIDPATLAVIEMEYEGRKYREEDEEDDADDNGTRSSNGGNVAPITPANPPDNGLFAPGGKPKVIIQ